MSDISRLNPPTDRARFWAALTDKGYLVTSDQEIGLSENFRTEFLANYFNGGLLRHDDGDMPADRERARDVVEYQWQDDGLHMREHETITITNRADIVGKREHARVWLLDDPRAADLVRALLGLVPPERRQDNGTFGINLFRTFTNVVTKPHHDKEEYIVLYILDRVGDGAESYLYLPGDVTEAGQPLAEPVFQQQLNPGDILMFEDKRFKHGATPLECPPGAQARRDVLVCTVDYESTYLEPGAAQNAPGSARSAPGAAA